ncbi:MAG: glycosyl hydrolase [Sphingomonas bacterium]|uniref:beta-glucosidase n=1 Tax=Sphingomonas bacterium TaxID=1895847 RepID=UPI00262EE4D7|nr:beta-glucosidase [Sphingomonas bacterium]MDB5703397.1 glycosyl hydrolase [Sphingomonas bacterium]
MTKRAWAAALTVALLAGSAGPILAAPKKAPVKAAAATANPDARAAALVRRMTRDEKLTLVFGYFGTDFPPKKFLTPRESRPGSAGYVPGIPRLGIPPQWQTDAGVGVATQGGAVQKRERTALPSGLATAASWNRDLAFAGGAMIGNEARNSGFNVMLAGGVDLMREPRNGRNFEYGGEDPLLAGSMVGAQIAGIQSNHIISTVKHYAVNDQETDRFSANSIVAEGALRTSDLLAFQFAIERSNPGSVMCSYNRVNGIYACENEFLLTQVLRKDWKWPGYVMSDWGATHSTAKSAEAGLDQDSGFPFDDKPFFGELLKDAVVSGVVSDARIDAMVTRILRSMIAHGLFEHPVAEKPIDYAAHALVTRHDAEEGIVLLKNANAILPLSPRTKRIAVIGGHADKGVLAGGGSSLVYPRGGNAVPGLQPTGWPGPVMYYPSSPMAAIAKQAPGAQVRFARADDPAAAAALARDSDVAIVFVTQWAGEAFDVPLTLTDNQDALVAAIAAANPKTVVVMETGGPILMPWIDHVAGAMAAWYPGTEGGEAIANLLFGKVNPSGRLPATFPRSLDQLPRPAEPNKGDTIYAEGATVGYKWYDAKGLDPQFPFGHGLSYTSFSYGGLSASSTGAGLSVRFTVRNTGKVAGKAVPQIYVAGQGWEAPKRLGGFSKVALAPGASQQVTVQVDPRLLATWDDSGHQWRTKAGSYDVILGASSRDVAQKVTIRVAARVLPVGWSPDHGK